MYQSENSLIREYESMAFRDGADLAKVGYTGPEAIERASFLASLRVPSGEHLSQKEFYDHSDFLLGFLSEYSSRLETRISLAQQELARGREHASKLYVENKSLREKLAKKAAKSKK